MAIKIWRRRQSVANPRRLPSRYRLSAGGRGGARANGRGSLKGRSGRLDVLVFRGVEGPGARTIWIVRETQASREEAALVRVSADVENANIREVAVEDGLDAPARLGIEASHGLVQHDPSRLL